MESSNQHKRYRWYLQFDEITWQASSADECPPFVNEENKEAWRRYLNQVIKKHLKEEAMKTPDFEEIELRIRGEKLLRIQWDEKQKRMREVEHYRRQMERPKIDFVPRGLTVNYEEAYGKYSSSTVDYAAGTCKLMMPTLGERGLLQYARAACISTVQVETFFVMNIYHVMQA